MTMGSHLVVRLSQKHVSPHLSFLGWLSISLLTIGAKFRSVLGVIRLWGQCLLVPTIGRI
jgi:hypothetical protein